jgi:hypothetical protein
MRILGLELMPQIEPLRTHVFRVPRPVSFEYLGIKLESKEPETIVGQKSLDLDKGQLALMRMKQQITTLLGSGHGILTPQTSALIGAEIGI